MSTFELEPGGLAQTMRRKKWVNGLTVALSQIMLVGFIGVAGQTSPQNWWYSVTVWVLATFSLYWRYSRPRLVTTLVVLCLLATVPLPLPALDVWWTAPIIAYHWARYGSRRVRLATLAVATVGSLIGGWVFARSMTVYDQGALELWIGFLFGCFCCLTVTVIAWFLGDTRRLRENRHRALIERTRQLEHEREQERVMAALDERARIAREMHDIVAHSLSVIITQADGARFAAIARAQGAGHAPVTEDHGNAGSLPGTPEQADETQQPVEIQALSTISQAARSSLEQMRSLLGVLRTDEGRSFEPLPALHNIQQLVEQMQGLGFTVEFFAQPDLEEKLPQGAELTSYRIVQEALTNVRKHSPTSPLVTVRLSEGRSARRGTLDIDVVNAAEPSPSDSMPGARRGLLGMRERVDMYGGSLHYGRQADGSFRVFAQIPFAL